MSVRGVNRPGKGVGLADQDVLVHEGHQGYGTASLRCRLLPWGNTRGGSAISPRTCLEICWGHRLLGRLRFDRGLVGMVPCGEAYQGAWLHADHDPHERWPRHAEAAAWGWSQANLWLPKNDGSLLINSTAWSPQRTLSAPSIRWLCSWTDAWYTHRWGNYFCRDDKIGIFLHRVIDFCSLLIVVITTTNTALDSLVTVGNFFFLKIVILILLPQRALGIFSFNYKTFMIHTRRFDRRFTVTYPSSLTNIGLCLIEMFVFNFHQVNEILTT